MVQKPFYHIYGVLRIIEMLFGFFNMTVRIGYGDIVPTVDIDFFNLIATEIFRKHRIFRHFGIQLVCKLTKCHTFNLKAAVVQILLDI